MYHQSLEVLLCLVFVAFLIPQMVFEVHMPHISEAPGMAYCLAVAVMKMCHQSTQCH